MSLLEALQLIGYSLGAVLPLWMGYLLFRERLGVVPIQRLLLGLGLCMVGWHTGNLVVTLRSLLGLDAASWSLVLKSANTLALISITVCYSLLLHVHIYLWARAQGRELTQVERLRIYLSYIPCLFLFAVLPRIWAGAYHPMITKLSVFVLPFAIWIVYALSVVAITEVLVARRAPSPSERRILRTLAVSFVGIAVLVLSALGLGLGRGTIAGQYLQTFANLGSLLPSALLAYYIYRYRFLELIIKESLIVATFAAVVLAVYLYGIRRVSDWAGARYGLRAGVLEAILILALTLLAAPLRGWLERSFRALFKRETALYRELVGGIGAQAGAYRDVSQLLNFIEAQITSSLSLGRVTIVLAQAQNGSPVESILAAGEPNGHRPADLRAGKHDLAYVLRHDNRDVGVMLIESTPAALTPDVRATLEVLAGQVAIAVEDCRLANENLRLERKLAEGERLAALGQMAATVAHEVKNPLSAIKSIAQVMSEDRELKDQHARDLGMIVGETDRLSKNVTQLLSFANKNPPAAAPCMAHELAQNVVSLFHADAGDHHVNLQWTAQGDAQLDGVQSAAARDALSNLVLNALQATPVGGTILIETGADESSIGFVVSDSGPGIDASIQEKIWEPFFTTRQRGTGLGLAIVRKRMEEAGGSARLMPAKNSEGARFELRFLRNRPGAT